MSNELLYERKPFLLAIQGSVTVCLLDGQTVEGEFSTQDDWHIFLLVNDAPIMIPRQQIRFIKGKPGQPIGVDTSGASFVSKDLDRQREITAPSQVSEVTPSLEVQKRTREASGTSTQSREFERTSSFSYRDEGYEGTVILAPAIVEDSGGTMVLDEASEAYEATMILEDNPEITPHPLKPVDPQATFILEEPIKPKVQPMLVCVNGPHVGQSFVVSNTSIMLGRASTNEVALVNDKEISRRHATITREGEQYVLQDQNSLNGTFVNNQPIMGQYYLQPGDVILVGVSHLEFRLV